MSNEAERLRAWLDEPNAPLQIYEAATYEEGTIIVIESGASERRFFVGGDIQDFRNLEKQFSSNRVFVKEWADEFIKNYDIEIAEGAFFERFWHIGWITEKGEPSKAIKDDLRSRNFSFDASGNTFELSKRYAEVTATPFTTEWYGAWFFWMMYVEEDPFASGYLLGEYYQKLKLEGHFVRGRKLTEAGRDGASITRELSRKRTLPRLNRMAELVPEYGVDKAAAILEAEGSGSFAANKKLWYRAKRN